VGQLLFNMVEACASCLWMIVSYPKLGKFLAMTFPQKKSQCIQKKDENGLNVHQ